MNHPRRLELEQRGSSHGSLPVRPLLYGHSSVTGFLMRQLRAPKTGIKKLWGVCPWGIFPPWMTPWLGVPLYHVLGIPAIYKGCPASRGGNTDPTSRGKTVNVTSQERGGWVHTRVAILGKYNPPQKVPSLKRNCKGSTWVAQPVHC